MASNFADIERWGGRDETEWASSKGQGKEHKIPHHIA